MQPVFTPVPPNLLRSMMATVLPASENREARDGPAWPVPMMIASNFFISAVLRLSVPAPYTRHTTPASFRPAGHPFALHADHARVQHASARFPNQLRTRTQSGQAPLGPAAGP